MLSLVLPYRGPSAGRRAPRPGWSGSGTGCRPGSSAPEFAGRRSILVWASHPRFRVLWHRHLPRFVKIQRVIITVVRWIYLFIFCFPPPHSIILNSDGGRWNKTLPNYITPNNYGTDTSDKMHWKICFFVQ